MRSTSTVASTVATTVSLASRLAALTVDFNDKLQETGPYEDSILEGNESAYDEGEGSEQEFEREEATGRSVGAGSIDRLVEVESPDHRPPPFQVGELMGLHGIRPHYVPAWSVN